MLEALLVVKKSYRHDLHFYNSKFLQVVFMIGERKGVQGQVICNVVAVIIHFTTLATFFWTNIMAWDIYKTFGQRTVLSHIRPKGHIKV